MSARKIDNPEHDATSQIGLQVAQAAEHCHGTRVDVPFIRFGSFIERR